MEPGDEVREDNADEGAYNENDFWMGGGSKQRSQPENNQQVSLKQILGNGNLWIIDHEKVKSSNENQAQQQPLPDKASQPIGYSAGNPNAQLKPPNEFIRPSDNK